MCTVWSGNTGRSLGLLPTCFVTELADEQQVGSGANGADGDPDVARKAVAQVCEPGYGCSSDHDHYRHL